MVRGFMAAVLAFAGLATTPAHAEWRDATSRHFILYADASEAKMRENAIALERLDQVLRRFMVLGDPDDAAVNKVTVFMTSQSGIRALCKCNDIAGLYQPRVSGPVAFSGPIGGDGDQSRIVLFHEYAHHFLLGSYDIAFPMWFSEGFAEFASTMSIKDNKAMLGMAAQHRAYGLLLAEKLTAEQMFDSRTWDALRGSAVDAFYGRGWLLTHFLSFQPERFKQFQDYLTRLNRGTPSLEAARAAFGDLKSLDKYLTVYLRRSRIPGLPTDLATLPMPAVAVRALSPGEAAMVGMRMTSTRGVDEKSAKALYARAAPVAARHPADAVVQGWLAEMAYDAGEDDAARAAADRAIAVDPRSVQGLLYRARIEMRRLARDKVADATAWSKARKWILAANRLDPDDADPLWTFWTSYALQGATPSKSAFAGLYRAAELVPQDPGVRYAAAFARLAAGENNEARILLRPLAYSPHAPADNPAVRMLAALDAGKTGTDVLAAGEEKRDGEKQGASTD